MTTRLIYCCTEMTKIEARLTNGREIYPHRPDLYAINFWKCDTCGNHVGTHHKTNNPTQPLGVIANAEIKKARQHIHRILDPLWEKKKIKRGRLYKMIAAEMGKREYHTANLRTVEEARLAYQIIQNIAKEIEDGNHQTQPRQSDSSPLLPDGVN